jgi:beta-barrel assembly-enhancing protease
VGGIVLSAAVILAGMNFPNWVAPHVPISWEKKFGDTLVGDFGGRFCEGAGGPEALRTLAGQLTEEPGLLNIRVVHAPMENAAALPGGHIVIFDELLKKADGPDEIAGVLAHEIAHVEERHTTEAMIRELGLGVFITALGGNTGASVESLIGARYSRDAESEADDVAIARLDRANISPAGAARFFDRMAEQEKKVGRALGPLSYLSTHPLSESRRQKFRGAVVKGRGYRPSLSEEEWRALFNICYNDKRPHAQRWEPF